MYLKYLALSVLGLHLSSFTTALQINIYSDHNCKNYIGSYEPGSCDPLPQPNGGIGSWLIVCKNNFSDNCAAIEIFSSGNSGCADEYAVTELSCSCNDQPWENENGVCQSTVGLGAHYWGLTSV